MVIPGSDNWSGAEVKSESVAQLQQFFGLVVFFVA